MTAIIGNAILVSMPIPIRIYRIIPKAIFTNQQREVTMLADSIGARIRALRKKKKMTQEQLARKAGCTQPTVADYENDRVQAHRATVLMRIAAALETTPQFLTSGIGPEQIDLASSSEQELLEAFGQLDEGSRAAIIAAARAMIRK